MSDQIRTEAQKQASRDNGKLGTGPTTQAGRERSAQNSLKHGLYSSRIVLANESQEMFDNLLQDLLDEYNPVGPTEHHFVEDMAAARWKIRRIQHMEAAAYDTDMFIHHDSFNECFQPNDPAMRHHDAATSINATSRGQLDFYDRSLRGLHRIYRNARADLERIQTRRLRAQPPKPAPAPDPHPAPPPPETSVPQDVTENSRNEPEPPPASSRRQWKTYAEPENFSFMSAVDREKLAPFPEKPSKQSPAKDDFARFFKPAA